MRRLWAPILAVIAILAAFAQQTPPAAPASFHFVLLGDRTGDVQPGVWEEVWKEAAAEKPAFVLGVGDTIEGMNDATAEAQWQEAKRIIAPYSRIPLDLAPGNHDIWSAASEKLFEKHTGHPPHYSFDYGAAHFIVLDNSRSDALSAEEMAFLESDLAAHQAQSPKFIVSHRPSWMIPVAMHHPDFDFHQLAKKYGVQFVIAGHVHQIVSIPLDGVQYFLAPSAGGHLRASEKYEDGWFFGYTLVTVQNGQASFEIKEVGPPHGKGRVSGLADWGLLGLTHRAQ